MLDAYWIDQAKHINDDPEDEPSYNLTKDQAIDITRQIKALTDENKDFDDTAAREKENIQKWHDNVVGINENKIERLTEQLLAYYRINKESNDDFKLNTPYAHVTDRKTPAKWIWDNNEKVISSLEQNGANKFIKIEKKINKNDIKKAMKVVGDKVVTPDGSILDCVKVTPQGRSVTLKVTED